MEQLSEQLKRGVNHLGLHLGREQVEQLERHLNLLKKWNAKLNLVGPGSLETWGAQHSLDSLAAAEWIKPGDEVVDVGSGAGFPGIPCAIARPEAIFTLLEPRANRAAFLQNVIAAAQLKNVALRTVRAADETARFTLVLGRAVAQPEEWGELGRRLCSSGGAFVLFSLAEPPLQLGMSEMDLVKVYELPGHQRRYLGRYVPRGTSNPVS